MLGQVCTFRNGSDQVGAAGVVWVERVIPQVQYSVGDCNDVVWWQPQVTGQLVAESGHKWAAGAAYLLLPLF